MRIGVIALPGGRRDKTSNRLEEGEPGWFLRKDRVVRALQQNELGAGNSRGEFAALVERMNAIVPRMYDEGRNADLFEKIGHVELVDGGPQFDRVSG